MTIECMPKDYIVSYLKKSIQAFDESMKADEVKFNLVAVISMQHTKETLEKILSDFENNTEMVMKVEVQEQ